MQAEPFRGAGLPRLFAKGRAANHRTAQGFQLGFSLRFLDVLPPTARQRDGAVVHEAVGVAGKAMPEARPSPLGGLFDQIRPQGVALDVAEDGQQVVVFLDGERLEAALIERAGARRAMAACQRCVCVTVSQRMNSDRSPSPRGQRTKCQWLDITHHARTRIGSRSLACPMISSNASKSRGLAKIRIRPTARLSTWYA